MRKFDDYEILIRSKRGPRTSKQRWILTVMYDYWKVTGNHLPFIRLSAATKCSIAAIWRNHKELIADGWLEKKRGYNKNTRFDQNFYTFLKPTGDKQ